MKANNCTEVTDARGTGLPNGFMDPGKQNRHGGFLIPAGILIGLGAGLLVDHVGSGFLIGLGLGFIGSGLIPFAGKLESEGLQPGSTDITMLLIGAFLVFIGIGIVLAPAALWPYAISGFLILTGIWLLVRGFWKIS